VQDLGRIQVTPSKQTEGYETRKEYFDRIAREEREQKAAEQKRIDDALMVPVRATEQELREAAREQSRKLALFWGRPLSTIASFPIDLCPVDIVGSYPTQTGPKDAKADAAAFRAFKDKLSSRGVTLSDEGWSRLGSYLSALNYHRQVSLADAKSWELAFARLYNDLGIFQATGEVQGELREEQPQPAARQEHNDAPTMKTLLAVDAGTQEGQRAARQIADDLYATEARPLVLQWERLLKSVFGYTVTPEDRKLIVNWFTTNNKSWLRHESFNECRRFFVATSRWPDSMLTPEEKALTAIENLPRSPGESDYSYRRRAQALAR